MKYVFYRYTEVKPFGITHQLNNLVLYLCTLEALYILVYSLQVVSLEGG